MSDTFKNLEWNKSSSNDNSNTANFHITKKNNGEDNMFSEKNNIYKYILLDIEGTTTPITFVKDVLYTYARENIKDFIKETWNESLTRKDVLELTEQAVLDYKFGAPQIQTNCEETTIDSIILYIQWSIDKDKKVTPLKSIQGRIWEKGYNNGILKSIVYDDVHRLFDRKTSTGTKFAIYSSGSRHAQKLLFKYTNNGDLRKYISCYFDTTIGGKRNKSSYEHVILSLGVDEPNEILFITDIIEEANAAREAGLDCIISVRPGNLIIPEPCLYKKVESFDEI